VTGNASNITRSGLNNTATEAVKKNNWLQQRVVSCNFQVISKAAQESSEDGVAALF
jgi:hypothetical protein